MPDVEATPHKEPRILTAQESIHELGSRGKLPSILGIWRLGKILRQSHRSWISLGQPADAIDSPKWDYVIKTFSPSMNPWEVKRQVSQVTALSKVVAHPNLVSTVDASATASTPYLVMPRLEAISMEQMLLSGETKPLAITLWITRQVAEALDAIHQIGWIHGNVTPSHILLSSNGHTTLIDVGMSQKIHTFNPQNDAIDRRFASPESLSGNLAAMAAMDIFSLGRVLWQWLTVTIPENRAILEPVVDLVEAMVSPEPNERPEAASVVKELKQLEFFVLGKHIGPSGCLQAA